eukprot:scaffold382515_cov19-Prasinocladus_malaysianus.AAC.1
MKPHPICVTVASPQRQWALVRPGVYEYLIFTGFVDSTWPPHMPLFIVFYLVGQCARLTMLVRRTLISKICGVYLAITGGGLLGVAGDVKGQPPGAP